MAKCEGRKGEALAKYKKKFELAKSRLRNMPYRDKEIIAAVFADGKSYTINGCEGMERNPEYARIIGKSNDAYKVVWGTSNQVSVESKAELSSKLDSYFGVTCASQEKAENQYDEER